MATLKLSESGKDELAIALILWKDFKSDGKFDIEVAKQMHGLAVHLDIEKNLGKMMAKVPPMRIEPRNP